MAWITLVAGHNPKKGDRMTTLLARIRKEDGATATEYVLLLVGVALILIVGALFLGNALNDGLSGVGAYVNSNATTPN